MNIRNLEKGRGDFLDLTCHLEARQNNYILSEVFNRTASHKHNV
jgi:hypothetical protein